MSSVNRFGNVRVNAVQLQGRNIDGSTPSDKKQDWRIEADPTGDLAIRKADASGNFIDQMVVGSNLTNVEQSTVQDQFVFSNADVVVKNNLSVEKKIMLNTVGDLQNFLDKKLGFKTYQILHFSDIDMVESVALNSAPNFSGLLAKYRGLYPNDTMVFSTGDNYVPGPRATLTNTDEYEAFYATLSGNAKYETAPFRADIQLVNEMGVQASVLGNHEFDLGTGALRDAIAKKTDASGHVVYEGAQFPYLAYNATFSEDSNVSALVVANGQEASAVKGKITGWVKVTVPSGEVFGILGAVTPAFATITSPGSVTFDGYDESGALDYSVLAAKLQEGVDEIRAAGIKKIIILSHMQKTLHKLDMEREIASRLSNVAMIIAGGSNTLMVNDTLRSTDERHGMYPSFEESPTGPVLIVNVGTDFKYLGRLLVTFDENDQPIMSQIDARSNAYEISETDPTFRNVTPNGNVVAITNKLKELINAVDGNVFGRTSVFLEGRRNIVRNQETNLGSLKSDSQLWYAQYFDASANISIANAGGIRSEIGNIVVYGNTTELLPPAANENADRESGEISQLAIQETLKFNNELVVFDVSAGTLKAAMEHQISTWSTTSASGRFAQIAGMKYSFDPASEIGSRIKSLAVLDSSDNIADIVVAGGDISGNAARNFRIVTPTFISTGGDGYPFQAKDSSGNWLSTSLLLTDQVDPFTSPATFASVGTEQDALARYLRDADGLNTIDGTPFSVAETPLSGDLRIQNLSARSDTVLS